MGKIATALSSFRMAAAGMLAGKSWKQAWAAGLDGGGSNNAKLDKPYEQSVWVFRAIQHVVGPLASMPLKWQKPDASSAEDPDRDRFWNRPARNAEGPMSRADFIEATGAWMQLEGHAFWIMDDSWFQRGEKNPSPLILARPDRMRPIKDGAVLVGWEYTDGSKGRHNLVPIQVCRPRFYNPYDELTGLAPWKAAKIAAESDLAAAVFAKNLMVNNGDRGQFVIAKQGVVDDAQRIQIEAMLRQKQELARRGIPKTAFLTGDITVEDPKVQSTDSSFVSQRLENRHEIFIAFGVPASMAQVTASYSVGSASDRYRLLEETCMPLGAKIAEHIERVELIRSNGIELQAAFDWSSHPTMRQVRQELVKSARDLFGMGMPVHEINEWLGLGLPSFKGDNVGYLPMALDPVGTSDEDETTPPKKPKEEDSPAEETAKSLNTLRALFESRAKAKGDDREALWKKHMKLREPHVKAMKNKVNRALSEARAETLKKLDNAKALESVKASGVLEIIFDRAAFRLRLWELMTGPIEGALTDSASQLSDELGLDDPWIMEDPEVRKYLDTRENKIKDAADHVWEDVKGELQDGVDKGESNAKLAERIRAKFTGLSKHRSETIAQTETGTAYGHARQTAMEATGIAWKEWLTARDEKVRAEHVAADGQQQEVSEAFVVAGEQLMGPCAEGGSPENVINCRCIAIPIRQPKDQ